MCDVCDGAWLWACSGALSGAHYVSPPLWPPPAASDARFHQSAVRRERESIANQTFGHFYVFMAFNSFCWILASHYLALLSFARSLELVQTQQKVFALSAGLDYHEARQSE